MIKADQGFLVTGGGVSLDLGPLFDRWQTNGGIGVNVTHLGGTVVGFVNSSATIGGLPLGPDEEQTIQITIRAPLPMPVPGTHHTYNVDLLQLIAGELKGGVSYVVTTRALDTDSDGDGEKDVTDPDDDNDGIPDELDPTPAGPSDDGPGCAPTRLSIRGLEPRTAPPHPVPPEGRDHLLPRRRGGEGLRGAVHGKLQPVGARELGP